MSETQTATTPTVKLKRRWVRLAESWRCSVDGCANPMRTCQRVLWFGNGAVMCEKHGKELEASEHAESAVPEPTEKPNRRARRERTIPA